MPRCVHGSPRSNRRACGRAQRPRARGAATGCARTHHRHRIAAHRGAAPCVALDVRRRRGACPRGGLRRRGAALRARLYHGVVFIGHQFPHGRLRRRREQRVRLPLEVLEAACAARSARISPSARGFWPKNASTSGSDRDGCRILRRKARRARLRFHFAVARRKVRRRTPAEHRGRRVSVHGPERL